MNAIAWLEIMITLCGQSKNYRNIAVPTDERPH